MRHQGAQGGIAKQQKIVGPLGGPGENHKQNTGPGADKDEKEHQQAVQPDLGASDRNGNGRQLRRGGR